MNTETLSIRTFIGSKNYDESIRFYEILEFQRNDISRDMIYFHINDRLGFYLQDYYVQKWVNNSMVFLEVENIEEYYGVLKSKELSNQFKRVKLSKIISREWGHECFLHDPSGVLWHIGQFNK